MNCIGSQPTLASMRAEKSIKFKELQNKRNSKEYKEWFFRYIPDEKKTKTKTTIKRKNNTKTKKKIRTKTKTTSNTPKSFFSSLF